MGSRGLAEVRRAAGQGCGAGAGTAKARTRASHRSCGRVSHTMVRARAQAYAISVRGRGAARDVGAQHVFFPLLGRLRRGRRCWRRVPGLVQADLAAEMVPGARFPSPSIGRTIPFDWCLLIICSRAQARGGRPLLLIGSQGCQSGPFSSLIGLLKKRGWAFPPAVGPRWFRWERAPAPGQFQFLGREVFSDPRGR